MEKSEFTKYCDETEDRLKDIVCHIRKSRKMLEEPECENTQKQTQNDTENQDSTDIKCRFPACVRNANKFQNIELVRRFFRRLYCWFIIKEPTNIQVSQEVYERLMLRYAVLSKMELLEHNYLVHDKKKNGTNKTSDADHKTEEQPKEMSADEADKKETTINLGGIESLISFDNGKIKVDLPKKVMITSTDKKRPNSEDDTHIIAYRLATTDLFVEKAIIYLEHDYKSYLRFSKALTILSFIPIVFGIVFSLYTMHKHSDDHDVEVSARHETEKTYIKERNDIITYYRQHPTPTWAITPGAMAAMVQEAIPPAKDSGVTEMVSSFIIAFTSYGFLVLFSVVCWRHSKVMMDQAERLRERRHSLRQGRLFIHLNSGKVTVDELEKAFEWNASKDNAFATMQTEASAPWGAVLKEAFKNIGDAIRSFRAPQK